jgi:hypothetical protein
VKWAGLEPKNDQPIEVGGGVKITINLGNSPEDARTIEADLTPPEEEDVATIDYRESV